MDKYTKIISMKTVDKIDPWHKWSYYCKHERLVIVIGDHREKSFFDRLLRSRMIHDTVVETLNHQTVLLRENNRPKTIIRIIYITSETQFAIMLGTFYDLFSNPLLTLWNPSLFLINCANYCPWESSSFFNGPTTIPDSLF